MFPAFDSGEDALWIGGPYEGFGIDVGLCDVAVDGDLQINNRSGHAAVEALAREFGEEAFESDLQDDRKSANLHCRS